MKRILKIFVVIIVLGVFVWTIYFLYKKSEEKPVVYNTETPFVTDIVKKTVATGSIVPRKEILIKPRVSGIIEKIYVEPGQKIKEGDLIAKVRIIPDLVTLNNAESRLSRAQLAFDNAKKDLERNRTLLKNGVISQAEFQQVELSYNTTREELEAASNNVQLIREGVTKRAGGSSNTLIRSTIAGMILDVPVEEGNSVIESNTFNEGTTIASVADMSEMIFLGKVDESEVGKVREGMDLIITVGAIENEKFDASLEYIAPKGVEENGAIQFEIRAAMNLKDDHFIRAGYSANADIVLDRRDSVLAIKESLLQFEKDSAFVEVENGDQRFEKKYIKLGLSDGINIEVKSGLEKDSKIKNWNQTQNEQKS